MADQYTPEEIQAIMDEYANAQRTGAGVSAELAKRMADAAKGVKNYTDTQNQLLGQLSKSVKDLTKTMYQGQQGMTAMNDAVDMVGTGLQVLINLIPGARLLKIGLTLATGALTKLTKVANEQGDKLFKSYQELSQSGLAASGGLTEVFNNMQKFGYGIEQLGTMTELLRENSKELANFGGTAADGTRAFAEAAGQIQRSELGKSLQMLGKTPDDINRGMANFIKTQQQLGISSAQIQRDLAQQSNEFIKNLDIAAKLTGESNAQLQAKLDQALAEDAFAAAQFELKKKADAGDINASIKYQANQELALRLTGEALKEFQRGVGGDIASMSKTLMSAPEAVKTLGQSAYTADQYLTALGQGAQRTMNTFSGLARFNATQDFILPFNELGKATSRYADSTAEQQRERAKAEQELQIKGIDPATKAQVEMRIAQMRARDSLQSFVQLGVAPATEAMAAFAKVTAGAAGLAPGTPGGGAAIGGGSSSVSAQLNRYGSTGAAPSGTQKEFYNSMYNTLLAEARAQGVPNPDVIAKLGAAQASLESGYGKRQVGNNYFGIKARGGSGGVGAQTQEFIGGKMVTVNDRFRGYGSAQESAADYIRFLKENPRYAGVLGAGNLGDAIAAQGRSGYATDPQYAAKLANISGRFENMTAGMNPSAAIAPDSQPTAGAPIAGQTDTASIWQRIAGTLENIENKASQQLTVNEKLLQMTQ